MEQNTPVIQVERVTMEFRRSQSPAGSLKELLLSRRSGPSFRALEDMSFSVAQGQVVGIVGKTVRGRAPC